MLLRCHPLFSYHGMHSWPPTWTWIAGVDNKHPKGEIGILRRVQESKVQPSNIDASYTWISMTHYTLAVFCAPTMLSAPRLSESWRLISTSRFVRLAAWTSVVVYNAALSEKVRKKNNRS